MEEFDETQHVQYLVRLKDRKQPIVFQVPINSVAAELHLRCQDDSLPPTFSPQEGHWVTKGKHYRVLGAKMAVNDEDSLSLALATQEGKVLNPYGDEQASFGLNAKRFREKEVWDKFEIFSN